MEYDQHVHTYFSFDSQAQFEDYLSQTDRPFITTEHLELSNPDDHGADDTPDQRAYTAKLQALKCRYPNRLLRGIECGYYAPRQADLQHYLQATPFDLVLLSFHHDGQYDYQDAHFKAVDAKHHVQAYYDRMLAGLQTVRFGDVLAHFDYGLRVLAVTPSQLEAWAKPQLQAILQLIVQRGMAFEVNTKSMNRWHDAALYELVLPWYRQAGGELITLGSDAHTADKFQTGFDEAKALLHRTGFTKVALYQDHRPQLTDF